MGDKRSAGQFYFEIFLIALAVILLEISFTRIFSFKVFYYFTYLIIGIALLGLGAGGIFVAILPRLREAAPARVVALLATVSGPATLLAFYTCAVVQLNASRLTREPIELAKLALICFVIFVPFLLAGVVLSTLFAARPDRMSHLYFIDLLGAGVGCAVVVFLLSAIGPPAVAVLCAALFSLAGLRTALRAWPALVPIGVLTSVVALGGALSPSWLPDPVTDIEKTLSPQKLRPDEQILHSEWNPAFRVDVIGVADDSPWVGRHLLVHDGTVGSTILRHDGNPASLAFFDRDPRSTPFAVLGDGISVVIIGAAGGQEILASLYFDAAEITGVELNSVTHSIMLGKFADYAGGITHDPRVNFVNDEGRSYVGRMEDDVDLIWLVAPDSYSAMNAATAGAFVLSESYLYTVEMVIESLERLKDGGLLTVQFGEIYYADKPKRTTRYLATVREAFRRLGIDDFEQHVLVSTTPDFMWPMASILVKKGAPYSAEEVRRFRENIASIDEQLWKGGGHRPAVSESDLRTRPVIWHAAGRPMDVSGQHPVNKVISLPSDELEAWYSSFAYDVTPIDDDRPFFWHFVRFGDAMAGSWGDKPLHVWDPEEATGERVLIVLLGFVVAFAGTLVFLPLVAIRDVWSEIPNKTQAGLYFAALGLGFMFYEISLIQQLTLLLGYPTHSLTVTLFALLTSAGLGSLATDRWVVDRNRALALLLAVLVVLMLWCQFGLGPLIASVVGLPFVVRVGIAVILVAPIGLCLGSFMPIGIGAVAELTEHKQQMVAWCWAVNGFFSVVASILATMLAMALGFRWVLFLGAIIYAVGVYAMTRIPRRTAGAG